MTNEKLRILFISTGLSTGGAEMMLYKLVSRLSPDAFEPIVVCLSREGPLVGKFQELGIPVVSLGLSSGAASISQIPRIIEPFRKYRPHLVQGWMYHGNLAALAGSKAPGIGVPCLWGIRCSLYHKDHMKRTTRWLVRMSAPLSRLTTAVIYCSETARRQHEDFGFAASKSVFIPNGFDLSLFAPNREAGPRLRALFGIPDSNKVVAAIGRSHPQKDHLCFLQSARQTLSGHSETTFLLIGEGYENPNHPLRGAARDLGIESNVIFSGERRDIPELLPGIDVVVSSSASGEGFPNILGEALSCGVPCVTTDVGDSAAVVGNPEYVVPIGRPDLVSDKTLTVLRLTPAERFQLGAAGREHILRHYSLEHVAATYGELYLRCAAQS